MTQKVFLFFLFLALSPTLAFAATQNAGNQKYTNNADGFALGGGTTTRTLSLISGDVTLTGNGSGYTYNFPTPFAGTSTTLVGIDETQTLTNKTWNGVAITVPYGGTGATTLTGVLKGNGAAAVTAVTGTANYGTRWTDANTLGTGVIYDNATNVGIGNAAPLSKLGVTGAVSIGATYGVMAASASGLLVEGNVGVGTTLAQATLQVGQNDNAAILLGFGGKMQFRDTATYINEASGLNLVAGSSRSIYLAGGTGTDMTISSTGNVGIGTTVPVALLNVGTTPPTITAGSSPTLAVKGNLMVDGKIYGDGSALTGISSSQWTTTGSDIYYNTGLVGIGTTVPATYALDVNGTAGIRSFTQSSTGVGGINVQADTTAYGQFFQLGSGRGDTYYGQAAANWGVFFTAGAASNGVMFGTYTNKPIIFGTNNTENMRIAAGGNVGIGTSVPSSLLEVGTQKFNVTSAGCVGIGSINPGYSLTIQGTGATTTSVAQIRRSNDTYGPYQYYIKGRSAAGAQVDDLTGGSLYGMFNSNNVVHTGAFIGGKAENVTAGAEAYGIAIWTSTGGTGFSTSNPPRVSINSLGNVGIGSTTPAGKLDLVDTSNTGAAVSLTNNTATTIGNGANTLGVLDLQSTSLTTGNFLNMELNAITGGKGINLTSTSTAFTGDLANLTASGSNAAVTGSVLKVGLTGANATGTAVNVTTGATSGFALRVNDDGTYTDASSFVVTADGNVGIGTTVPVALLNVGTTPPTITAGSSPTLAVKGNLMVDGKIYGDGSALTNLSASGTVNSGTAGYFAYYPSTGTAVDDAAVLYTDGTNVGIGSTAPTEMLDIKGTLGAGSAVIRAKVKNTSSTGYGEVQILSDTVDMRLGAGGSSTGYEVGYFDVASNHDFQILTNDITRMSVKSSGNVGIGTTTPGNLLVVSKDQNAITRIQIENPNAGTSAGTNLLFTQSGVSMAGNYYNNDSKTYKIATYETGAQMYFSTENLERMRIDDKGNVGIGTSLPKDKLSILGSNSTGLINLGNSHYDLLIGSSVGSGAQFRLLPYLGDIYFENYHAEGSSSDGALIFRQTWGVGASGISERMRISSSGNVGIGTTAPLAHLQVGAGTNTVNPSPVLGVNDVLVTGNMVVDGAIYGNGSQLTGVNVALWGINDQTGTSYTLVLSDTGKLVRCNNASAITLTIPKNSSVAFSVGTRILVEQVGAGVVTVSPVDGDVTIESSAKKTWEQYSVIELMKVGENTWNIVGGSL